MLGPTVSVWYLYRAFVFGIFIFISTHLQDSTLEVLGAACLHRYCSSWKRCLLQISNIDIHMACQGQLVIWLYYVRRKINPCNFAHVNHKKYFDLE